jgi:hypothetical protein
MFSALSVVPAQAYVEQTNPTDQISLTGTPAVDTVLTLTKQKYSNVTERSYNVSWLRCNSAISLSNKQSDFDALLIAKTCTIISQSTSTTYTVVAADAGKHITGAVYIADFTETVPPSNSKWGISIAPSLLIAASAPTPTPTPSQTAAPTLTAQTAPATVPATIKPKKKVRIGAKTSAGLPVTVTVAGGCKVKPVVKTTKTKVGKKTVKTKTTTAYTVTMGKKKGATCTITQANAGDATYAPLNSVSTVTLK